ncbi:MAG: C69 family dipeptidase [Promethearchaeota archaeon]
MCDTFVILPEYTKNGNLLFGKNSDRDPDETQNVVFIKGGKHNPDEVVKCTYLEVPQAEETYDAIISQPFWMYGCEMGANQFGLVIGNEAVFTTEPLKKTGLLGMDIMRLALERTKTAEKALLYIIELLETYGQGGGAEYHHRNASYHNSWIIADPNEAYVLESAGVHWVWKEVEKVYSISNALTIESDYDGISENAIKHAIKKGRCRSESDFSFKKCYTARGLNMAAIKNWGAKGDIRRSYHYSQACMVADAKASTLNDVIRILRLHQPQRDKKGNEVAYDPSEHSSFGDICVHYSGAFVPSQSVNSFAVESSRDFVKILTTCGSAPCIQIYRPLILYPNKANSIPSVIEFGTANYDESKIWWRNELFHRLVLMNYVKRTRDYFSERDKMEEEWIAKFDELTKSLSGSNSSLTSESNGISNFINQCFQKADELIRRKTEEFLKQRDDIAVNRSYLKKWQKLNEKNGIPQ